MKRIVLISGAVLVVLAALAAVWVKTGLQRNLRTAHAMYKGTDEEVLLAFLADENNAPPDRTYIAVWSLGELRSKKALPVLKGMVNETLGEEHCKGAHHWRVCQHEIKAAIGKIEQGHGIKNH